MIFHWPWNTCLRMSPHTTMITSSRNLRAVGLHFIAAAFIWRHVNLYSDFKLSVESNSEMLGFYIAILYLGLKISRNLLNQSNTKPIASQSRPLPALRDGHVYLLRYSYWFIVLFASFVIGQKTALGLALRHLNGNHLKGKVLVSVNECSVHLW